MSEPILSIALRTERDVVHARQRVREIAASLGFDNQDQIRLATATSEMARNAFRYARNGTVEFSLQLEHPQHVEVSIRDSGPGISNLQQILDGRYRSETGMGMGILGTKRLMDEFELKSSAEGTVVRLVKRMPRNRPLLTSRNVRELEQRLRSVAIQGPYAEIERQNQELLKTLQELRSRQEELTLLNRELEDTNRGVVALYAELDERADYLRRASELKTKFLSNVSHEFRTPLNSIVSLSHLLLDRLDGELTPEQDKQVRYIESSARDLQEMVNDLLDIAKVEAGKIKIRVKEFEVQELFSALKGMLKPLLADNTAVDLVFEDPVGLAPLHTDEGKVSQIVRNLISNALKFTPRGSVTVCARRGSGNRIIFEVADTGIGIPAEYHETIFQEFSQIENPLQDRHRGTGLGLPLCRNLATLLGGRLWLESRPGAGSRFFVEIPAVYLGEAKLKTGPLPSPEFHRAPVLLLEDDEETGLVFESLLRDTGFQAVVANEISQAEEWLQRHTPVAIVSDIYIGDNTAYEFLAGVRRSNPTLPLIMTSAYASAPEALAQGADLFLPKPLERESLLRELHRLTSRGATRRLLIVDDNEVSRYILREILDQPWLRLSEAGSGGEALRLIAESAPDAVILDLLMPDVSGLEILRRLRQSPDTNNLPVLIYTSKSLSEAERKELASLRTSVVRKEDVSARLSAQPFLQWLSDAGLTPETAASQSHA
ncbi:MAG TPA: ATP-binding protein [Terriglobales bacterium]|nr:ATP-binding protein [Terriglobales bacterium]